MNSSKQEKWPFAAICAVIGLAIMVFAPDRLFGIDSGLLGSAILLLSAWAALYLFRGARIAAPEAATSVPEIRSSVRARIALAVRIGVAIYFVAAMQRLGWSAGIDQAQAGEVARNIAFALIAWSVLAKRFAPRPTVSAGNVCALERRGNEIAHAVLALGVAGVAVSLALMPMASAAAASPALLANLLVAVLIASSLAGALVRAWPSGRAST